MRSNPGVIYSKPLSQTTATTKTDDKSEGQPAVVAQVLIPAFERPMPENSCEFKVSLGHTVSSDQPVLQTETLCCVLGGGGVGEETCGGLHCNLSTLEGMQGGSGTQGHPELHGKFLESLRYLRLSQKQINGKLDMERPSYLFILQSCTVVRD